MASKKLQYSDIAEQGLFDPLIKEIKQVNDLLKKTEEGLKGIATENAKIAKQTPFDDYESIEKKEKAIRATVKATEELDKIEKERVRLNKKLAELEDERAKANAALKVEISERNRQLREEAKLNSDSFTAYQKLSIRLGQLRKQYKDTAIQYGRNSKEAKALRKEIGELSDSLEELDRDVKQQFREIGRYENALKKLNNTAGKLGALGLLFKGLETLKEAFTANQAGADLFAKALGRITIVARVVIGRVISAFGDLRDAGRKLQIDFKEIGLNIQLFFAELPELLGGSAQKTADLQAQLAALRKEYAAISGGTIQSLMGAFKGVNAEIQQGIKDLDKLIDTTTKYREVATGLKIELGELAKEQTRLQQIADDNTLALEDQAEAAEQLFSINAEIAQKQIQLAQQEVRLAKLRVDTDKGSLVAKEEYAGAVVALLEAEAEAENVQAENARRLREIERDNIELDLDQLIDLADRRKTINETIAKDERLSFQTRQAALERAQGDIEKSFRAQAQKIQEGIDVAFNIDDLINEEDSVKLNERIKALGLDEIRQNRLREILQERIQATEDLRTATDDLTESEAEGREIRGDIIAQEEALRGFEAGSIEANILLAKLEERRLELQKENLRLRIEELEVGSVERLRIEQELNELLLSEAQAAADKEVAIEKAKQKQINEAAQQGFQLLSDLSDSYYDKRIENIDKEIEAAERRENELRELAAQGNQTAEESLAAEIQRREQAELQRAQALKRQKLAELALSAIEVYGNKVAAGDKNPLASTIADVSLLRAFIESLPPFYEGAELVSDALPATMPGRDGHIVRVDGAERILSPSQNAMIPRNMSNLELASLAANPDRGGALEVARLEAKLEEVRRAIQGQEVYKGLDFENKRKAIVYHIEQKGKMTRKHKSIKSVWG